MKISILVAIYGAVIAISLGVLLLVLYKSKKQVPTQNTSWVTVDENPCSVACGGGVKTRVVECTNGLTGVDEKVISDDLCDQTIRPEETLSCNEFPCAGWSKTSFTPDMCKKNCGPETQNRNVTCVLKNKDGTLSSTKTIEENCKEKKPPSSQDCGNPDCVPWNTKDLQWGECTKQCDLGNRIKDPTCPSNLCDPDAKPAPMSEDCNTQACKWKSLDWQATCKNPNVGGLDCSGHGTCNIDTKLCVCNSGYIGPNCDSPTKFTAYIEDDIGMYMGPGDSPLTDPSVLTVGQTDVKDLFSFYNLGRNLFTITHVKTKKLLVPVTQGEGAPLYLVDDSDLNFPNKTWTITPVAGSDNDVYLHQDNFCMGLPYGVYMNSNNCKKFTLIPDEEKL